MGWGAQLVLLPTLRMGTERSSLQDSLRAGRQGSPRRAPLLTDWWVPPGAPGGRCTGTPSSGECGWLTTGQFLPGDTSEA